MTDQNTTKEDASGQCASTAGLGSEIVNHKEAFELACYKRENSNLARSYIELHALLNTVWHCMNDDNPPDFPMRKIEEIVEPNVQIKGQAASGLSLLNDGLCVNFTERKMDKQWPVRLEIKRHIAPPDKWHWCVIFNGGHVYAVSETFESAEICVVDAGGAGMDALHGAERCLTHNVKLTSPPTTAGATEK